MLELQHKIKRQIEILGLAIDNTSALRDVDFAALFGRDIPTIKRDMQELRGLGIDMHSAKLRGVRVLRPIDTRLLKEIILQYLGICSSTHAVDKATAVLVKKHRDHALSRIVTLQRCIESSSIARITYEKDANEIERDRDIGPLVLFNSEGSWRVLAVNDGRMKQYHLIKMRDVKNTGRRFRKPPQQEISDLFRHSFRSWIGTERHTVRIRLNSTWAERVKPQQLLETQDLIEEPDGSIILQATVNSLDEVASWVVTRGEGVVVLEPQKLRDKVVALARGALKNYPEA